MEQEFIYRFDRFAVDLAKHVLLNDREQIHLTPKAFHVLVVLLSASGALVSRAELMNKVWAGCCVEDSNISQTVSMLRKALEDRNGNGARRCISTLWGRGYRVVADVERVSTLNVGALERPLKDGSRPRASGQAPLDVSASGSSWSSKLTPAERRVLQMIADNRMSRQIAAELGISVRTVENHRAKIRAKLGITGPDALLRCGLQQRREILQAVPKR